MQQGLLPLFPLQVVLFPRTPLSLHIFEDRYKEMIGEAIRTHTEFGVVLARQDGILNTGCTATVEKVLKEYPDGRLDVLTLGRRRFEILLLNEEQAYLRGAVEFFDDDEPAPASAELAQRAREFHQALWELWEGGLFPDPAQQDPQLSFQLAQIIDDLDFRQQLLRLRSEAVRMKKLVEFLEQYLPKKRLTAQVKRVAPLDGHGRPPSSG
jgi:ATP-dependent Lon protease